MNRSQLTSNTKEYVDAQLTIMKKYGSLPHTFSSKEYDFLVEKIVKATELARSEYEKFKEHMAGMLK